VVQAYCGGWLSLLACCPDSQGKRVTSQIFKGGDGGERTRRGEGQMLCQKPWEGGGRTSERRKKEKDFGKEPTGGLRSGGGKARAKSWLPFFKKGLRAKALEKQNLALGAGEGGARSLTEEKH